MPEGFGEDALRMGKNRLAAQYHAGIDTVERWIADLGLEIPERNGRYPMPVEAVCDDGEILQFPSAKEAARELYGVKEYINHAAKYGCRAYGMVWRYAEG